MTIWVDGDACPRIVKEIVFKRVIKTQLPLQYVANSAQKIPRSPHIHSVIVSADLDAADHYIVEHCQPSDLVITADIPLAYEVVKKKVFCLSPKGEVFSEANIGERLATRDLLTDLRSSGLIQGGPAAYGSKDRNQFAAAFDQYISQSTRSV